MTSPQREDNKNFPADTDWCSREH